MFPLLLSLLSLALLECMFVSARDVPQNLKNFVAGITNNGNGQCQKELQGGFYSQDPGSGDYAYCGDYLEKYGIVYLQGPKGQLVNMDIDCDGDQRQNRPGNDGRCGSSDDTQGETSFGYIAAGYEGSNIKELNAFVHAYAVFGNEDTHPSFHPQDYGIEPLSIMAVVCNDKLVYGVWGDENGNDGPKPMVGEASIGLATLCFGQEVNGNAGHDDTDVMFIAFKGTQAVPGKDANWNAQSLDDFEASITALGDKLVSGIGSSSTSTTTPTATSTPSSTTGIGPSSSPSNPTGVYWYVDQDHTGAPRGYAPYTSGDPSTYPVFRNVKDFGAKGDGQSPDADAIQTAINAVNSDGGLNRYEPNGGGSWMARPAQIFVPGGTYIIDKNIDFRLNTILVGDPNNRPVFKASSAFSDTQMIKGLDYAVNNPTMVFFMGIKNIIFDTTDVSDASAIAALDWSVSQACQLTNVEIIMPNGTQNHVGININGGSLTALNDVTFRGGNGINFNNQQANIKGMAFIGCKTGIKFASVAVANVQSAYFENCGTAIDFTDGGNGVLTVVDNHIVNSGPLLRLHDTSNQGDWHGNQVVIENLQASTTNALVVNDNSNTLLPAMPFVDTWIWGQVQISSTGSWHNPATNYHTPRPQNLLDANGRYFTMTQPTYAEWNSSQVVNVKAVPGLVVKGDGRTNDGPNLNTILQQNANNGMLSYFPYGVYAVEDTLLIPAGSRIVGEAWPVVKAQGSAWNDESNPNAVVQVGASGGDTGVAQIQDMRFTVGDVMPGAIILEVNMASDQPGDVGFWNTHVTVGGSAESAINQNKNCLGDDTSKCKASFLMVHLTANSGPYIENMWGWTADHGLDPGAGYPNKIASGRGILVEATKGTWLTGTGFEHNTLYNYNFNNAQNIYAGMLQTETAYWQGTSATPQAPAPFSADARYGDPDFSWCGNSGPLCHMTLGQNINGGNNMFLYATGDWAFFNDIPGKCNGPCIYNHARVTGNPTNLFWYGHDTAACATMILDDRGNPQQKDNKARWDGGIAAYLEFSGQSAMLDHSDL